MQTEKAISLLQERIAEARELLEDQSLSIAAWHGRTQSVLLSVFGPHHRFVDQFRFVRFVGPGGGAPSQSPGYRQAIRDADRRARSRGLQKSITLLETAVFDVGLNGDEAVAEDDSQLSGIFLVHGHDARRDEVARVIRRLTEEEPTILHEQPDQGRTIIEKFEHHASTKAFAVVLATADDVGGEATEEPELKPRARQNVIFETGFFVGALGRSRVALLYEPEVDFPSDYQGVIYIRLDSAGAWKTTLARELNAAGIPADANKL